MRDVVGAYKKSGWIWSLRVLSVLLGLDFLERLWVADPLFSRDPLSLFFCGVGLLGAALLMKQRWSVYASITLVLALSWLSLVYPETTQGSDWILIGFFAILSLVPQGSKPRGLALLMMLLWTALIYLIAGIEKARGPWLSEPESVNWILNHSWLVRSIWRDVSLERDLSVGLSWLVVLVELTAALLLICSTLKRYFLREIVCLGMITFHFVLAVVFSHGYFQLEMMAIWFVLMTAGHNDQQDRVHFRRQIRRDGGIILIGIFALVHAMSQIFWDRPILLPSWDFYSAPPDRGRGVQIRWTSDVGIESDLYRSRDSYHAISSLSSPRVEKKLATFMYRQPIPSIRLKELGHSFCREVSSPGVLTFEKIFWHGTDPSLERVFVLEVPCLK